jgi:hypothetical protein
MLKGFLAAALGLLSVQSALPPPSPTTMRQRRQAPAASEGGSTQAASAYRSRKRIHPGTSSSLRKVQKALRIQAGVRAP